MARLVGPSVANQVVQRFRRLPGGVWTLAVLGVIAVVAMLLAPVRDFGPKQDPHVINQGSSISASDLYASPQPHVTFVPRKPEPSVTALPKASPTPNLLADLGASPAPPPTAPSSPSQQTGTPAPPTAPPTLSPAAIARRRQADADSAAMAAPISGGEPIAMTSPVVSGEPDLWLKRAMIVKANMVTSLDSSLPGLIIAQLSEDLLDSSGQYVVAPQGSKLIGMFNTSSASFAQGQARVPVSLDTIQLPDGTDIALGSQPGTDRTGTSGIGAAVDRHLRGQVAGFLLLAAVSSVVGGGNNCPGGYCAQSYGGGSNAASAIIQAGQQMLGNRQQPAPTLHVSEGSEIALLLMNDIKVKAWRQ